MKIAVYRYNRDSSVGRSKSDCDHKIISPITKRSTTHFNSLISARIKTKTHNNNNLLVLSTTQSTFKIVISKRNDVLTSKSQLAVKTVPNKPTQWSLIPVLPFYRVKKFNFMINVEISDIKLTCISRERVKFSLGTLEKSF